MFPNFEWIFWLLAGKNLNVFAPGKTASAFCKISSILIGGIAITLDVGSTGIGVRVSQ